MVLFKTLMSTLVQFAERKILLLRVYPFTRLFLHVCINSCILKSADHHKWQEPLLKFPDSVVKNLPANVEDTGFIPSPGTKIPPTARQLSPGNYNYWAHTHNGEALPQESPPTHTCCGHQWWLGRPPPCGGTCSQWQRKTVRCSSKHPA